MEASIGWSEFADLLPGIAWRAAADGTVEEWNARWSEITGVPPNAPPAHWLEKIHPDDRDAWLRGFRGPVRPVPFTATFRLWSAAHSEWRPHLARVSPQLDGLGRLRGWTGIALDLGDQAPAGEAQALADSLARVQEEQRDFAYGASHDLREMVRMQLSYLDLLSRRCSESLDGQALEYIGFALDGARRLNRLVDDLLTYSRVSGSEPLELVPVEVAGAIQWAMMNLAQAIRDSGASITWDPMPVVMANENRLVLVIENLLANAVRFARADDPPRIHITAEQVDEQWVFCFADNGTGFDDRLADKAFSAFKRLHGREYPGNGLGLAIARRVIDRHHGRMWAQSSPGEGSRFYFSLPA